MKFTYMRLLYRRFLVYPGLAFVALMFVFPDCHPNLAALASLLWMAIAVVLVLVLARRQDRQERALLKRAAWRYSDHASVR